MSTLRLTVEQHHDDGTLFGDEDGMDDGRPADLVAYLVHADGTEEERGRKRFDDPFTASKYLADLVSGRLEDDDEQAGGDDATTVE